MPMPSPNAAAPQAARERLAFFVFPLYLELSRNKHPGNKPWCWANGIGTSVQSQSRRVRCCDLARLALLVVKRLFFPKNESEAAAFFT